MKKLLLQIILVIIACPLILVGFLALVARNSLRAGWNIGRESLDWIGTR